MVRSGLGVCAGRVIRVQLPCCRSGGPCFRITQRRRQFRSQGKLMVPAGVEPQGGLRSEQDGIIAMPFRDMI